jgi:hypothetical protein
MVEELSIELGHSPSSPTTGQKVRFSVEATGNVSRVEIFVNGRLATTCAGPRCHCLVGPFPAGPITYFANAYGQTRMVSSGKRQVTVTEARPAPPPEGAKPPKSAIRVRPAKPPKPAVRVRPAKPPEPKKTFTISGRLTGETGPVKEVNAINQDRGGQRFVAPVGSGGTFKFSHLPEGRYRVYPVPRGKLELISEPRYHEVRCGGRQSYTCSFEIKDIDRT